MSSSNSLPDIKDIVEDMSEGPQEAAEGPFDFKDWLQSSLEASLKDKKPFKLAERLETLNNGKEGFLDVLRDVSEDHGKKRLFVCCDGTWLNASGTVAPLSNVAKLARSVNCGGNDRTSFETIGGVPQLVYYSSGVGTRSSLGMDSSVAAATGKGISHVIRDAYCFLSNNYNGVSNKDEIILLGFSRGAFTVRCLAEFISRVGLLRRKALPFLPVFFDDWVRGDDESLDKRLEGTRPEDPDDPIGLFYDDVDIKVLAEWDPVDTLGIPYIHESGLQRCMEAQIVPKKVKHAFLALSLGEKRLSYWPTVWKEKGTATTEVSQCAFLGDHGDVGGGHPDPGLSTITLLWMVSKIRIACGANFQMWALLQFNTPIPDPAFRLWPFRKRRLSVRNLANTKGMVHRPSFWWFLPHYLTFGRLFSGKRGSIINGLAENHQITGCNLEIHQTVRLLMAQRNVSPGPLDEVVEQPNDRYKWTLKDNSQLIVYEQQLDADEEKLLRRWNVEAQIWGKDSEFRLENDEEYINHNWRYEWEGVITNRVWGFEESGKFDDSLIKVVYENIQVAS